MASIEKQLVQCLAKYPNLKLAILFGSQATGTATPSSDIDLALLADQALSSDYLTQLIEDLGMDFGCPIDIIDLYDAPEPILGQVFKGRRLLGDNSTYAQLLTKHLLNTADFVPLQQRILKERREAWIKQS